MTSTEGWSEDQKQAYALGVVCSTCGKLMRFLGEWPYAVDRDEGRKIVQVYRWICSECKLSYTNKEGVEYKVPTAICIPVENVIRDRL
jgi:hypothetical protein